MISAIITTIQTPTESVNRLASQLAGTDSHLIIVGDSKGPFSYPLEDVSKFNVEQLHFLSLEEQLSGRFKLALKLPVKHYSRKNIGYLHAIANGSSCIYETDDDNSPLNSWDIRKETVEAQTVTDSGWVNVYRNFTKENIWPRGFPLDEVTQSHSSPTVLEESAVTMRAPIQQGLANGSPDVDAVWRLVLDTPFDFDDAASVCLPAGAWCPFNSQSTWWWPDAYPLMYLPSYCSFRMTDIWRSFIAQRCLWEMGFGVVFHSPEVFQERNEHDLMRDFSDEIPGYLRNRELVQILEDLNLEKGPEAVGINLLRCYEALVSAELFPEKELVLVRSWLDGLGSIRDQLL